jgi:preprotein translocase subunit SecA
MRLFGSERLMSTFDALGVEENEQIEHKMLSRAIEQAQKKIESNNFGIRKNLLEYDRVNNDQREVIYAERRKVLDGDNMRDVIMHMMDEVVSRKVDMSLSDDQDPEDQAENLMNLTRNLLPIIPVRPITPESVKGKSRDKIKQALKEEAAALYTAKEAEFADIEQMREIERVVLLKVIDARWMNHIDDMEQLRQGIGLTAYAQRDPKVEYRMIGFEMFDEMTENIQEETLRVLYHVRIEQKIEREEQAKPMATNKDDSLVKKPVARKKKKIYPNDPCPCGSGKKYKNCHGVKGAPPLDL